MDQLNENPLVSICIPTFNRGHLIWRALESCINQTYKNIEIVVNDNASSDNTEKIVSKYILRDSRVKYFRNETNIGSGRNYLKCAERASGYFVQTLGDDDWLSKSYVENCVKNFKKDPGAAAVFTASTTFLVKDNDYLNFVSRNVIKPGRYSASWFFKNVYRHPSLGGKGFVSFLRREDFIKSLKKEILRPTSSVNRGVFSEVIDSTVFFGILIKYDYFFITKDATYISLIHKGDTVGLQGGYSENFLGRLNYALAIRRAYEAIYSDSDKLLKYRKRMSFSMSLSFIVRTFSEIFRTKTELKKFKEYYTQVKTIFLSDYSRKEKFTLGLLVLPYSLLKMPSQLIRLFSPKPKFVPSDDYFLTKELMFKTD